MLKKKIKMFLFYDISVYKYDTCFFKTNTIAFPFKMIETCKFSVKLAKHKSSHLAVFCKNVVRKNFSKFLGEHLRQKFFLNKL